MKDGNEMMERHGGEKPPKRLERLNLDMLSFTLPSGAIASPFLQGPLRRSEGVEKQKKGWCCSVTLTRDSSNVLNVILKTLSAVRQHDQIVH